MRPGHQACWKCSAPDNGDAQHRLFGMRMAAREALKP